jgi:hypothetical protein
MTLVEKITKMGRFLVGVIPNVIESVDALVYFLERVPPMRLIG